MHFLLVPPHAEQGYSAYQSKNQTQLDGSVKEISKRVWRVRGGTNSLGKFVSTVTFFYRSFHIKYNLL